MRSSSSATVSAGLRHHCLFPVDETRHFCLSGIVNSSQFRRYLAKQGCTFENGKGGHLIVRRGDRVSVLPQHGGKKQLKTGLMQAIRRQLGIE